MEIRDILILSFACLVFLLGFGQMIALSIGGIFRSETLTKVGMVCSIALMPFGLIVSILAGFVSDPEMAFMGIALSVMEIVMYHMFLQRWHFTMKPEEIQKMIRGEWRL